MDNNDYLRDVVRNNNEESRNKKLVNSIVRLADAQKESNHILVKQCAILNESNIVLVEELKKSKRESRHSMILNIVTTAIAVLSLASTIVFTLLSMTATSSLGDSEDELMTVSFMIGTSINEGILTSEASSELPTTNNVTMGITKR